MANGTFFASWELWQQMTFVLATCIAIVFFVGLMKLWWANRHMKKLERLDAEKQVRVAQMRRCGLPPNRRSRVRGEIPFGVKAIETGVEVEGVWVARMASMASRPPDRKWSSKRKVKTPFLVVGDQGFGSRPLRGSSRVNGISRREILEPSTRTRKKLDGLPRPEEEVRPNRAEVTEGNTKGPLGRIQRGLKKMTSTEAWDEQNRKHQLGRQEARELHTNAQATQPQRFYPETATTTPNHWKIPQRTSSLSSDKSQSPADARGTRPGDIPKTHPTREPATAPHGHHESRNQRTRTSSVSSVESLETSIEELKEFAPSSRPPPLEHHPVFSGGDSRTSEDKTTFGRRRSRLSSQSRVRHSSSEDRSTIHDPHDAAQSASYTGLRYPPNSSRSAAFIQPRPQSFTPEQEQQQQQHRGASSAAQPSPTFGPSDSYINTSTRKVNPDFEVLPAGTFGLPETHAEEPARASASVRSSLESQLSGGRRKLQKKRTSSH